MANEKSENNKKQAVTIPDGDDSAVIGVYPADDIISCGKPTGKKIKVKRYNFKRPDKFSRDQLRTLSIMHETFARLCTVGLSAKLKTNCNLRIHTVDQMCYEEFIGPCENPSVFCIVHMDPLKGSALFQIDNALSVAMIQIASGGQAAVEGFSKREITDIDSGIIESLFLGFLGNLREAWSTVMDARPRLGAIDTNPQFVQIQPPTEMVVLITFDCVIGDVKGKMNFCLPFLTIEPIISRLMAKYWYSSFRREISKEKLKSNLEWTTKLAADTSVYYHTVPCSLAGLAGLKKGSLIPIPGMKEGRALLECGHKDVLSLSATRPGRHDAFTVQNKAIDDLPSLETPGDEEWAALPVKRLEKKLTDALEKIEARIMEVSARQTELADQAFFGQPGAGQQEERAGGPPLQFAGSLDRDQLAQVFSRELPQVTALALSCMDPVPAGDVLGRMPEHLRSPVALCVAGIGLPAAFAIEAIGFVLRRLLEASRTVQSKPAGGAKHLAAMLASVGRTDETNIIDALRKDNKSTAEEVEKRLTEISGL